MVDDESRTLFHFSVFLFTQVYLINKIKNKFYGNVFGLKMPLVNFVCLFFLKANVITTVLAENYK